MIYLPGIMGSELVAPDGTVLWGMKPRLLARQALFRDVLARLAHPRDDDAVRATRPLQFPVAVPLLSGVEPYRDLERKLATTVLRPQALRAFAYDWRRSIADSAAALAVVAREHLREWRAAFAALPGDERRGRPAPMLTLVGHSMGGLVASYFATVLLDEGGADVRRVVTLGTPFAGSVKATRILATGDYLPLGLLNDSLRDATRTMPGVYELVARFPCVDLGDDADGVARPFRRLEPADLASVGADEELATDAAAVRVRLAEAIAAHGGGRIRTIVGSYQPTLQSVRFGSGDPVFAEVVEEDGRRTDLGGDGTVHVEAARLAGVDAAYLPQSHGALAKTNEAVHSAASIVTERPLRPLQSGGEVGLRVPELVPARSVLHVEAIGAAPGTQCLLYRVEPTDALVTMMPLAARDDVLAADVMVDEPGTYRVLLSAGGNSPVEQLVAVVAPD